MLIAIGKTGDVQIVSEPRKMMTLANGLAVAGLPNPRPRTGGDSAVDSRSQASTLFQSEPPHGGRPGRVVFLAVFVVVSRAPARGATRGFG